MTEGQIRQILTEACGAWVLMDRPGPLAALLNSLIDEVITTWRDDPDYDPLFGFACAMIDYQEGFDTIRERVAVLDPAAV